LQYPWLICGGGGEVHALEQRAGGDAVLAGRGLSLIGLSRLNAKHLYVQFQDGSRWEEWFGRWRHAP
jgi:hypothetical protein